MPKSRLARSRYSAFIAQRGLCYYCLLPTWHGAPVGFRAKWNLTLGETRLRQCTAEHLIARKEGGGDGARNIVAACLRCNQGRHGRKAPFKPDRFQSYVRRRIQKGRWHQPCVLVAFGAAAQR